MPQALFRTLLLFLAAAGVAAPAQARLTGVAIGVSRYADVRLARAALPGAAVDAEAVDAALKAHGAAAGEMFLGADAAPWNAATHSLPGALKDDEFGGWIDQLRAKGASVWFVVDACNGGGLARGGAQDASARVLDPALLGLPSVLRGGRSD